MSYSEQAAEANGITWDALVEDLDPQERQAFTFTMVASVAGYVPPAMFRLAAEAAQAFATRDRVPASMESA